MQESARPLARRRVAAYGVIYVIWGTTFLAIRVGVQQVPPLLFAAMRFATAGAILMLYAALHGETPRSIREWRSLFFLGCLFFLVDYGLLFWAERRVESGLAAVMLATIPLFMAVFEATILKTFFMSTRLVVTLLMGLAGVAILVSPSLPLAGPTINKAGAVALLIAAVSWSFGTVISKRLTLPRSKEASSGAQMLIGGLLLVAASHLFGETGHFDVTAVTIHAWIALAYLITAGSILGFTAYVWLLSHDSPTRVGTYAYVNPVVALIVGALFGAEHIGPRSLIGSALVLVSVILSVLWQSHK